MVRNATLLTLAWLVALSTGNAGLNLCLAQESSVAKQEASFSWNAGGEALLFRPYFENPSGLVVMRGNGGSREDFQNLDFRWSNEAGYRTWLGAQTPYGVGIRAIYWAFDPGSVSVSARPPANGFGNVSHPPFGSIDIGSSVPADRLTATGSVKARVAIGEMHQQFDQEFWHWNLSGGVEHAWLDQSYAARLVNDTSGLVGSIDSMRQFQGTGPTLALGSSVELLSKLDLFAGVRGSFLFGRANSNLLGGEDLDLNPPLITTLPGARDQMLTRFESRVGANIHWVRTRAWMMGSSVALEAQDWIGGGSPSTPSGNFGLFGIAIGLNIQR